jgi:hypothetical protein
MRLFLNIHKMAVYAFSIIESNLVGNTPVTIQENSTPNGMALLLNNVGNEKYLMRGVKIWSSNPDQLNQEITLITNDPNGNRTEKRYTPDVDSYSFISKLDVSTKGYHLDGDSQMLYTILPNTEVKMTVSVEDGKNVTANLSNLKILEAAVGKGDLWKTIQDSGMIYTQENSEYYVPNLNERYDQLLNEPEEQKIKDPGPVKNNLNFSGKISKKVIPIIEKKPINIVQYNTNIVLFLAAITVIVCIVVPIDKKILYPFKIK